MLIAILEYSAIGIAFFFLLLLAFGPCFTGLTDKKEK
jgi:hypothetical protein